MLKIYISLGLLNPLILLKYANNTTNNYIVKEKHLIL